MKTNMHVTLFWKIINFDPEKGHPGQGHTPTSNTVVTLATGCTYTVIHPRKKAMTSMEVLVHQTDTITMETITVPQCFLFAITDRLNSFFFQGWLCLYVRFYFIAELRNFFLFTIGMFRQKSEWSLTSFPRNVSLVYFSWPTCYREKDRQINR